MSVGSPSDDKQDLFVHIPDFVHAVEEFRRSEAVNYDLVVSHYWLSGLAGLDLSAEWSVVKEESLGKDTLLIAEKEAECLQEL